MAHLLRLAREAGVDLPGAILTDDTRAQEDCLAPLLEILCSNAADTSVERFDHILAGVRPNPPE